MAKRATLKPGELPNVCDTDAPEMHPATVVGEGYVGVDASKCTPAELAEVEARHPRPHIYTPPTEAEKPEQHNERHTASRTTTITVSRTTTR